MKIFTLVYGDSHVAMFCRGLLQSLAFPQNKEAIKGATWNIVTDDAWAESLTQAVGQKLPDTKVYIHSTSKTRDYSDPIQSAMVWQVSQCLEENEPCLIAPPDTIFGDGTVGALKASAFEKNTCIALPHPRVLPSLLETSLGRKKTNPELVRLAWKHLHKSWTDAEVGHKYRNSFVGGVSWVESSPGVYLVKHLLPTVYYAQFTPEDLQYLKLQISFGAWDHTWPGDVLVPRGRQRTIGASDAAFVVEITDRFKNVPPLWDGDPNTFWKEHPHNRVNQTFFSVFREEEAFENSQETKTP